MGDKKLIENIKESREKENLIIYFAHTLGERDFVAEEIIPQFEKREYEVINPFAKRLESMKKFGADEEKIRESLQFTPRWVVMHDLADMEKCDALIVYNPNASSYGTSYETGYAWLDLCIPIFYVVAERYLHHPWINFIGKALVTGGEEQLLIDRMDELFQRD